MLLSKLRIILTSGVTGLSLGVTPMLNFTNFLSQFPKFQARDLRHEVTINSRPCKGLKKVSFIWELFLPKRLSSALEGYEFEVLEKEILEGKENEKDILNQVGSNPYHLVKLCHYLSEELSLIFPLTQVCEKVGEKFKVGNYEKSHSPESMITVYPGFTKDLKVDNIELTNFLHFFRSTDGEEYLSFRPRVLPFYVTIEDTNLPIDNPLLLENVSFVNFLYSSLMENYEVIESGYDEVISELYPNKEELKV